MRPTLSMNGAADILACAFAPWQTHVRAADGNSKLVLTVLSEPVLVKDQEFTRQQVTDSRRLESIICQLREHLDPRGDVLLSWSFPMVSSMLPNN